MTFDPNLQASGLLLAGHEGSESSNQSEGSIVRDGLGFKSANSLRHSSQVMVIPYHTLSACMRTHVALGTAVAGCLR